MSDCSRVFQKDKVKKRSGSTSDSSTISSTNTGCTRKVGSNLFWMVSLTILVSPGLLTKSTIRANMRESFPETEGDVSRLPFSRSHLALGGLAVSLGFESLLAANINLDLLRLGFGLFGQLDFQHAIVIVGAHLPRVHGTGQRE